MKRAIAHDAVEIRNEIRKTELAFDEALLQSARLMQRLVIGRRNPELHVNAGQEALVCIARAQQQVISGTSEVFRAHEELGRLYREMGGRDDGTPTTKPTGLVPADDRERLPA